MPQGIARTFMDAMRTCPVCGQRVVPGAAQGLCPKCLIQSGLETRAGLDSPGGAPGPDSPSVAQLVKLFPQLEIMDLIGRGGMGAVYRARQVRLNRLVALKILLPAKQNDPRFAERFEREAHALATLNHPNIIAVYDFGETQGHYFLLMEMIEGLTLRQTLQGGRMPAAEALAIISQICQALQYAHERGIVHRDIKPENILLDTARRVRITDFGIAKLLEREPRHVSLTGVRDVVGTPLYMAPEQIEKPQSVDHRADIYSLGVVFYEILTGELPIGKFQPPSQKVQIDVRLDEVVLHALEKEPERRYQQVSHVKSDVETISTTPGKATSLVFAGTPPTRRWIAGKRIVALAGLSLILLVGLAALIFPRKHRPAIPLRESLVSLWSGEKNAFDSMGTNNGKLVNVTFTQGVAGQAFHLNGSNAYVQIPDSPALKPRDLTVEAWVKLDAQESHVANKPGQQFIVFKLNTRAPQRGYFEGYSLAKDGDHFSFTIASPEGQQACASSITAPQPGGWYHLAGKYDSSGSNLEIYVNGMLEGSAYAGFPLDCGTRPLFIGTTGESWDGKLEGAVDEVALYNRPLTPDEIHEDYEAVRSGNPRLVHSGQANAATDPARSNASATNENALSATANKSLVARWSAAESGKDSAGTNGALLDHVTFSETKAGRTFVFNGTNASIRVPAGASPNVGTNNGFTIECWINPASPNEVRPILEWNQGNHGLAGTGVQLWQAVNGPGELHANVLDINGNNHPMVSANGVLTANTFQHIALTYDKPSGVTALYRNGMPVATQNLGSFTPQTSFDLYMGVRPSGPFSNLYFNGKLDEISLYDRALSAGEIQAIYHTGSAGKYPF